MGIDGDKPTRRGLPPAALGTGLRGNNGCRSPKRDSQGIDPLSGCGQSPPGRQCRLTAPLARSRRLSAPRAGGRQAAIRSAWGGCAQTATSPRAGACRLRHFGNAVCMNCCPLSVFPARLPTIPDGQTTPTPCSPPRQTKIRRATLKRFCPQGKQRRSRTPAAPPCPCGARQRRPTHYFAGGRLLLLSLPPSSQPAAASETRRSNPAPCSWGRVASTSRRRRWPPTLSALPARWSWSPGARRWRSAGKRPRRC